MRSLMKADWYKLTRSKAFWITGSIIFFLVLAGAYFQITVVLVGRRELPVIMESMEWVEGGAYQIYFTLGTAINYVLLLLPIFMLLFCHDFEYHIVDSAISTGITRRRWLLTKYIEIFMMIVVVYVGSVLVALLICTLRFGFGLQEDMVTYWQKLGITMLGQVFLLGSLGAFFLTIRSLLKKTTTWIGIYFSLYIISGTIFMYSDMYGVVTRKLTPQFWMLSLVNHQFFTVKEYGQLAGFIGITLLGSIAVGLMTFQKRDIG